MKAVVIVVRGDSILLKDSLFPETEIREGEDEKESVKRLLKELNISEHSVPSPLSIDEPRKFMASVFLGKESNHEWVPIPVLLSVVKEKETAQKVLEVFGLMRRPPEV